MKKDNLTDCSLIEEPFDDILISLSNKKRCREDC